MDPLGKIQTGLVGGLMLLVAAMAFYILLQDRSIDDLRRQRDAAVDARRAAERTIIVMADQAAQQRQRNEIRQDAREDIVKMPEADRKQPLSDIWRRAFRAADEIGGVK
jgi:hypothetical protein